VASRSAFSVELADASRFCPLCDATIAHPDYGWAGCVHVLHSECDSMGFAEHEQSSWQLRDGDDLERTDLASWEFHPEAVDEDDRSLVRARWVPIVVQSTADDGVTVTWFAARETELKKMPSPTRTIRARLRAAARAAAASNEEE
jgi:hypothetical protein